VSISEAREGFIGRDLVGLGECNHGDDQSWSIFLERQKGWANAKAFRPQV